MRFAPNHIFMRKHIINFTWHTIWYSFSAITLMKLQHINGHIFDTSIRKWITVIKAEYMVHIWYNFLQRVWTSERYELRLIFSFSRLMKIKKFDHETATSLCIFYIEFIAENSRLCTYLVFQRLLYAKTWFSAVYIRIVSIKFCLFICCTH